MAEYINIYRKNKRDQLCTLKARYKDSKDRGRHMVTDENRKTQDSVLRNKNNKQPNNNINKKSKQIVEKLEM